MKLCIPIAVKPEGGMYTFLGNFKAWLTKRGMPFTSDLNDDYDVLFVNSWMVPPSVIRRLKRERPTLRVVQRVDGSAEDYGSDPSLDGIQARVNVLADLTIFQSEYSKYSTREKFRLAANDGPVIYNPVDVQKFMRYGPWLDLPNDRALIGCASWSTNRMKGAWQIDDLAKAHPTVTFVLCGPFPCVAPRQNVVKLGHLTRQGMATALRSCHVFLNLSEHDPCPNVVLEALASGLPVLYTYSGGVPELVGECGFAVTPMIFRDRLDRVRRDRVRLSQMARDRAVSRFACDVIFPQYMDAIASAKRRPTPSTLSLWELVRQGYPVLRSPRELISSAVHRVASWTW